MRKVICGECESECRLTQGWLSETLGIPKEKCRVGMFSIAQCQLALEKLRTQTLSFDDESDNSK